MLRLKKGRPFPRLVLVVPVFVGPLVDVLRARRGRNGVKPDFEAAAWPGLKNSIADSPGRFGDEGVEALRISPPGELKKSRLLGVW